MAKTVNTRLIWCAADMSRKSQHSDEARLKAQDEMTDVWVCCRWMRWVLRLPTDEFWHDSLLRRTRLTSAAMDFGRTSPDGGLDIGRLLGIDGTGRTSTSDMSQMLAANDSNSCVNLLQAGVGGGEGGAGSVGDSSLSNDLEQIFGVDARADAMCLGDASDVFPTDFYLPADDAADGETRSSTPSMDAPSLPDVTGGAADVADSSLDPPTLDRITETSDCTVVPPCVPPGIMSSEPVADPVTLSSLGATANDAETVSSSVPVARNKNLRKRSSDTLVRQSKRLRRQAQPIYADVDSDGNSNGTLEGISDHLAAGTVNPLDGCINDQTQRDVNAANGSELAAAAAAAAAAAGIAPDIDTRGASVKTGLDRDSETVVVKDEVIGRVIGAAVATEDPVKQVDAYGSSMEIIGERVAESSVAVQSGLGGGGVGGGAEPACRGRGRGRRRGGRRGGGAGARRPRWGGADASTIVLKPCSVVLDDNLTWPVTATGVTTDTVPASDKQSGMTSEANVDTVLKMDASVERSSFSSSQPLEAASTQKASDDRDETPIGTQRLADNPEVSADRVTASEGPAMVSADLQELSNDLQKTSQDKKMSVGEVRMLDNQGHGSESPEIASSDLQNETATECEKPECMSNLEKVTSESVSDEPDKVSAEPEMVSNEPEMESAEPDRVSDEPEKVLAESEKVSTEPEEESAEPDRVSDEPEKVLAESEKVSTEPEEESAEPEKVSPELQTVLVDPEKVSDEPEVVSDEPEKVSDEPDMVSDEPEKVSDEPEVVSDEPEKVSDEPDMVSDEPEKVSDEPEVESDEPEKVSDEPEMVSDEPEKVSEEPEVVSDEPEIESDEPEKESADSEKVSAEPEMVSSNDPEKVSDEPEKVPDEPEIVSDDPGKAVGLEKVADVAVKTGDVPTENEYEEKKLDKLTRVVSASEQMDDTQKIPGDSEMIIADSESTLEAAEKSVVDLEMETARSKPREICGGSAAVTEHADSTSTEEVTLKGKDGEDTLGKSEGDVEMTPDDGEKGETEMEIDNETSSDAEKVGVNGTSAETGQELTGEELYDPHGTTTDSNGEKEAVESTASPEVVSPEVAPPGCEGSKPPVPSKRLSPLLPTPDLATQATNWHLSEAAAAEPWGKDGAEAAPPQEWTVGDWGENADDWSQQDWSQQDWSAQEWTAETATGEVEWCSEPEAQGGAQYPESSGGEWHGPPAPQAEQHPPRPAGPEWRAPGPGAPGPGAPGPRHRAPGPEWRAPGPEWRAPGPGAPGPQHRAPGPEWRAPGPVWRAPGPEQWQAARPEQRPQVAGWRAPGPELRAPGRAPNQNWVATHRPEQRPLAPGYRPAAPEYRPPAPGYRAPTPEYRPAAPGYRPPAPGYRPPAPGYRPAGPEYRPPAPGYCAPAPGYRPPAPVYRPPAPEYRAPAPGYRPAAPPAAAPPPQWRPAAPGQPSAAPWQRPMVAATGTVGTTTATATTAARPAWHGYTWHPHPGQPVWHPQTGRWYRAPPRPAAAAAPGQWYGQSGYPAQWQQPAATTAWATATAAVNTPTTAWPSWLVRTTGTTMATATTTVASMPPSAPAQRPNIPLPLPTPIIAPTITATKIAPTNIAPTKIAPTISAKPALKPGVTRVSVQTSPATTVTPVTSAAPFPAPNVAGPVTYAPIPTYAKKVAVSEAKPPPVDVQPVDAQLVGKQLPPSGVSSLSKTVSVRWGEARCCFIHNFVSSVSHYCQRSPNAGGVHLCFCSEIETDESGDSSYRG